MDSVKVKYIINFLKMIARLCHFNETILKVRHYPIKIVFILFPSFFDLNKFLGLFSSIKIAFYFIIIIYKQLLYCLMIVLYSLTIYVDDKCQNVKF